VTGHLLNRQREREQEEPGGRERERERGDARGKEKERPGQSVEYSAGERGDGWTVGGKMVRERRKRKGMRERTKRYTKRGRRVTAKEG